MTLAGIASVIAAVVLLKLSPTLAAALLLLGMLPLAMTFYSAWGRALSPPEIARAASSSFTSLLGPIFLLLVLVASGWASQRLESPPIFWFALVFGLVGLLINYVGASSKEERRTLMQTFSWSYGLGVGLTIGLYFAFKSYYGEPYLPGDAMLFDVDGRKVGLAWLNGAPNPLGEGPRSVHWGYFNLLGAGYYISYWLFDEGSILAVRLINPFLGSLLPLGAYKLAKGITPDTQAPKLAAWLTALFPSVLLFASITLRETYLAFLILWFTVAFTTILRVSRDRKLLLGLLLSAPLLYLIFTVRQPAAVLLLGLVLVYLLILGLRTMGRRQLTAPILGLMLVGIVGLLWANYGALLGDQAAALPGLVERELQHSVSLAGDESVGLRIVSLPAPLRLLIGVPLLPLIPAAGWTGWIDSSGSFNVFRVIFGFGAIMTLLLFPALIFGTWRVLKEGALAGSYVVLAILLIIAGAVLTTFDTRHEIQVLPMILVLAAVGWRQAEQSRTSIYLLGIGTALGTALAAAAYLILKL